MLLLTRPPQSTRPSPEVLMIRNCAHCATLLSPGSSSCDACGGKDLPKVPSTGLGEIRTWTVVDRESPDSCGDPMPCLLAVVALDDGPWICTWLEGEIAVRSDQHVRVQFDHTAAGDRYPVFCACGAERDQEFPTD
ncbi:Zn-ribbon domain-containing OB-fold protein [Rhodococcus oryzae]|uniref:Zn-ribbon domain-containing OB-fold protein n=1 Tax=Rhodococcus oryzae TaxID=2571143 RepID=UPI00371052F0